VSWSIFVLSIRLDSRFSIRIFDTGSKDDALGFSTASTTQFGDGGWGSVVELYAFAPVEVLQTIRAGFVQHRVHALASLFPARWSSVFPAELLGWLAHDSREGHQYHEEDQGEEEEKLCNGASSARISDGSHPRREQCR
jgi:hypothetical protein